MIAVFHTSTLLIITIICPIFGYMVAKFFSGKHEGESGRIPSLKIPIGNRKYLWIHHWLWIFILLIILIFTRGIPNYFDFFIDLILIGGMVQGLTYNDALVILHNVPPKNRIK